MSAIKQPKWKVRNQNSEGFCVFSHFSEAVIFYKDGLKRGEPYEFIVLDVLHLEACIKELDAAHEKPV